MPEVIPVKSPAKAVAVVEQPVQVAELPVKQETPAEIEARIRAELEAKYAPKPVAKAERDPRLQGDKPLPEGYVIPAKAVSARVDERGTVHTEY